MTPRDPIERGMPSSVEAEAATLGCILISSESLLTVADIVQPDDFHREQHRIIYRAMLDVQSAGMEVDIITVTDRIIQMNRLDDVGGRHYLTSLLNATPTWLHAGYHAEIVARCAFARRLVVSAGEIAGIGYDDSLTREDALERAEKIMALLAGNKTGGNFQHIRDGMSDYWDQMDTPGVVPVPTGFKQLDRMTGGGFRGGELIVVGARPAMGKTSLGLALAVNAAKQGTPVALFSIEMSRWQIWQRLISMDALVHLERLRTGCLTETEADDVIASIARLSALDIYVDDSAPLSINQVANKLRHLCRRHPVGLVIVDYVGLMSGMRQHGDNRVQEVATIAHGLKMLARELSIPVVALSQLSRSLEARADKRPMLSDIRESGDWEQDGDIVIGIYRDVVYNPDTAAGDTAELIVLKQRNGPTGTVQVAFIPEYTRFAELERRPAPAGTW